MFFIYSPQKHLPLSLSISPWLTSLSLSLSPSLSHLILASQPLSLSLPTLSISVSLSFLTLRLAWSGIWGGTQIGFFFGFGRTKWKIRLGYKSGKYLKAKLGFVGVRRQWQLWSRQISVWIDGGGLLGGFLQIFVFGFAVGLPWVFVCGFVVGFCHDC